MITKLRNPKTELYYKFKKEILDKDFAWFHNPAGETHPSFFSHIFLRRPDDERSYPSVADPDLDFPSHLVREILHYNNIQLNCIFRMNINLTYPQSGIQTTPVHVDHDFPHQNLLIYFTNAGGKVFVGNKSYDPKEDDVITFGGEKHYIELPKKDFRIALVTTYF